MNDCRRRVICKMFEFMVDYELESFGSVCSVMGNYGVFGYDLSDVSVFGVEIFGGYLIIVSYFFFFKVRIKNILKVRFFVVKILFRFFFLLMIKI